MPSYSTLIITSDEGSEIAVLAAADSSIGAIARSLGRAKSTISRELERNRLPRGRYSPRHADGAYLLRRQRHAAIEQDERLGRFVRDRLAEGWSPEQIAGWLKASNETGLRGVCTETIYAFVYRARQKAEDLWRYLTRRRRTRRPMRASRPSGLSLAAPAQTVPPQTSHAISTIASGFRLHSCLSFRAR